jgi:hypothetical protein
MPNKSPVKRGRGRPEHKPTVASRRTVSIGAGGGMRHEDIALALGINRDTLTKHYALELSTGAAMRRLEVLQAQYRAALKKGSTSAAKAYLAVEPELAAPPVPPPGVPAAAPAPAEAAPVAKTMGKKEQQAADAVTAGQGTEWESLLKPGSTPIQ